MSSRRVGVAGLEVEGELYAKMRRLVGVEGGAVVDDEATGRAGEAGRCGDGGVTSVCNIEVKIAFACSANQVSMTRSVYDRSSSAPLRASDSVGMILLLDGVEGQSSIK